MYRLHFGDGSDDLHQEDEHQLNERDIFSRLVLRIEVLQKREYIDLSEVIEEGVKQGGLIHGIDHIHVTLMEQMIRDDGVIPLGGVPEEAVAKSFLELVRAGHNQELSTKRGECQIGQCLFM